MSCTNDPNNQCSCNNAGPGHECCESITELEQLVNDAVADKETELSGYVDEAKQSAEEAAQSATAAAGSASEAKGYRDQAETAATSATGSLKIITDTALILEESGKLVQEAADEVLTAIAGIAVRNWYPVTTVANQTTFTVPSDMDALAVQTIYTEGVRQDLNRGFKFDKPTMTITLAEPIEEVGTEITVVLGVYNTDPADSFPVTLASSNGASLVGTTNGNTVQEELNNNLLNDREQWRRTLAEAGLTLVAGSFEEGATVNSKTDAVWHIAGGQCYTWDGATSPKTVPVKSTPTSTGGVGPGKWLSVGDAVLRTDLKAIDGINLIGGALYTDIRGYAGSGQRLKCLGRSNLIDNAGGYFVRDDTDTTSTDNDGTIIVDALNRRWKREYSGGLRLEWFGGVSDYYMPSGVTVNPTPTDSSTALQKAVNALNGNGTINLTGFFHTSSTVDNGGILNIQGDMSSNRGYDYTAKTSKHYQVGIHTSASAMFNPTYRNASFIISGCGLYGNGVSYNDGTNKLFNTSGKTNNTDYFLAILHNNVLRNFGDRAIDGSLGSWLWDITGNSIGDINGNAVYLDQPNNARVDHNLFEYRNKGDLITFKGTAFSHRYNLHNFDCTIKEYCAQFKQSNNYVSELNYMEQYGSTVTVNGGSNTRPYIVEIDHFENKKTRAIRNNFCQLAAGNGLARFITIRRTDGQDFNTNANVDFVGNNLSPVPPYFLYFEKGVPTSTNVVILNGVSARNDINILTTATSGKIFDDGMLMRVTGDGLQSAYVTTLTSPVTNTRILPSNCTEPLAYASNFFFNATSWRFDAQLSAEICVAYQWTSTAAANFTVDFDLAGNVFSSRESKPCVGTSGAGTFTISTAQFGSKSLDVGIVLRGTATLCDTFKMQIIVK